MKDKDKTKEQLVSELEEMRQQLAELDVARSKVELTEEILKESEEKYRSIIENMPMGVHLYQTQLMGKVLFTGDEN